MSKIKGFILPEAPNFDIVEHNQNRRTIKRKKDRTPIFTGEYMPKKKKIEIGEMSEAMNNNLEDIIKDMEDPYDYESVPQDDPVLELIDDIVTHEMIMHGEKIIREEKRLLMENPLIEYRGEIMTYRQFSKRVDEDVEKSQKSQKYRNE